MNRVRVVVALMALALSAFCLVHSTQESPRPPAAVRVAAP